MVLCGAMSAWKSTNTQRIPWPLSSGAPPQRASTVNWAGIGWPEGASTRRLAASVIHSATGSGTPEVTGAA